MDPSLPNLNPRIAFRVHSPEELIPYLNLPAIHQEMMSAYRIVSRSSFISQMAITDGKPARKALQTGEFADRAAD